MADQVSAAHILLMYKGAMRSEATRSKDEALALIEDLQKQLADGADFAELAKAHSDCPSGQRGGELGAFGRGQMVPEFESAAFDLDVGGTSEIVETAFGYHLIHRTA